MGYNRQLLWKNTHIGDQIKRKARKKIKEMTQIFYVIFYSVIGGQPRTKVASE